MVKRGILALKPFCVLKGHFVLDMFGSIFCGSKQCEAGRGTKWLEKEREECASNYLDISLVNISLVLV